MATRQRKKVKDRVKNLFLRKHKKSSKSKESESLLKESEVLETILDDVEQNKELDLTFDSSQTAAKEQRKTKRRSVRDLLHGRPGGRAGRDTGVPSPGTETYSGDLRPAAASSKKDGEKSKPKRKVSFSPTSTKYIELEASQEDLEVCVVEEPTIKKKKSRRKQIKKGMRKAARRTWRYVLDGFTGMALAAPYYAPDPMHEVYDAYSPQYMYSTACMTPMYMTTTTEDMYTPRYYGYL